MKKAELIKYFKSRFPAVNEGGGDWSFTLKDDELGFLHLSPNLTSMTGFKQIGVSLSMSPGWYRLLMNAIFGREVTILFHIGNGNMSIKDIEITNKHLDEISQMALDWYENCFEQVPLAQEFRRKYAIYNRLGSWQFKHIMACVLKGDVEKLQSYLDMFKHGDRMEFIPIIHQEYFERAIPLAEKYRSGELISPVYF